MYWASHINTFCTILSIRDVSYYINEYKFPLRCSRSHSEVRCHTIDILLYYYSFCSSRSGFWLHGRRKVQLRTWTIHEVPWSVNDNNMIGSDLCVLGLFLKSAGLRVPLKLKKFERNVRIIDCIHYCVLLRYYLENNTWFQLFCCVCTGE